MEHESCESATGPILSNMPLWIRQPLMFKTCSLERILFVLSVPNITVHQMLPRSMIVFIYCLFKGANIGPDLLRQIMEW